MSAFNTSPETTSTPGHGRGWAFAIPAGLQAKFRIGFDGHDAAAIAGEKLGHFAVARADFDPGFIGAQR